MSAEALDARPAAGAEPLLVTNALPGADARDLALRAGEGRNVLVIARNAERLAQLRSLLAFFAPGIEPLAFPAWDTLPFDRVSPRGELMAERLATLAEIDRAEGPRLVLTTANAFVQRVLPQEAVRARRFEVEVGGTVDRDQLLAVLQRSGYRRAGQAMEPGDYAVRGGLIDVFPAGDDRPLRLDLFGDQLESLRRFDPLTQRSEDRARRLVLQPVSEVALDPESVERFRAGFRQHFGAVTDDPLYETVSAGRHFAGVEHWLPLFVERTVSLLDYFREPPLVIFDHLSRDAIRGRQEAVGEQYQARLCATTLGEQFAAPYRPLPPDALYFGEAQLRRLLDPLERREWSVFAQPEGARRVVDLGARPGRDFADLRAARGGNLFEAVVQHVRDLKRAKRRVLVASHSAGSAERLRGLLRDHGLSHLVPIERFDEAGGKGGPYLATLELERGFEQDDLAVLSEADVFGDRLVRPAKRTRRRDKIIEDVATIQEGDFVVHDEHGIGRYDGLTTFDIGGAPHACVRQHYANNHKQFVPVENLDVLSRYGAAEGDVALDRLGGVGWQNRRAKVRQRIKEIADEITRIAAERKLKQGERVNPETGLYDEFVARFPFDETEDQLDAIEAVMDDLASGRPMDRLVCGDVGFGKTEVALRAAFVVAMSGKQVALLAPTTLLVRQHFQNFKQRFAGFPIEIGQLSRFVTGKEATKVKSGLKSGEIDVAIGTHALLGKTIDFKDLGLVIVDEEQHFGVAHKERLKQLRAQVHVLTLTATPIPRTLQMSMTGLKELSIIATPPVDRLAVNTFVMPADPVTIREAILREYYRGGQIFYVCPQVEDQPKLLKQLQEMVPEVKIAPANGQMKAADLDAVMTDFYERRIDVLLSTNIVESGLDVPNANTLIVHRADRFGLSQLYQLRGRVGRSKVRGYAYFTLPPRQAITELAERRLSVIQGLDQLGAGFQLASHDLDIRGAGNLLGAEQSGHIKEVGYELYSSMLEEAIKAARERASGEGDEAPEVWTPQITVDAPALIPEDYVPDLNLRLSTYRRLAKLDDDQAIEGFAAELIDRFGPIPAPTHNLLQLVRIKRLCRVAGVVKVDAGPKGIVVAFRNDRFARPERLVEMIQDRKQKLKLRPDHRLFFAKETDSPDERLKRVEKLVGRLAAMAQA